MSSLQRSFAKAKLAKLPMDPPLPVGADLEADPAEGVAQQQQQEEEGDDGLAPLPQRISNDRPRSASTGQEGAAAEEDSSSSASSASSAGSTGTIKPQKAQGLFARARAPNNSRSSYEPVPWTFYFQQELYLPAKPPSRMIHHAYLTPPSSASAPLFVMHHGAGSSGLSFAACTAEMRHLAPDVGVLALDARGHGETSVLDAEGRPVPAARRSGGDGGGSDGGGDDEARAAVAAGEGREGTLDMSLETLAADLERVLGLVAERMGWKDGGPNLILVGHSLGGAVVTHAAKSGKLGNKVLGYAVLDVVEGSAIDALQSMQSYLSVRPKTFPSVQSAIEWHIRSRTIRSSASARVSVPSLLTATGSQNPTSDFSPISTYPSNSITLFPTPASPATSTPPSSKGYFAASDPLLSAHVNLQTAATSPINPPDQPRPVNKQYTWRTDLGATSPFWESWFKGLSSKFLSARGAKLLLLAGTDRLDKELMIGQMQGKYQLQVYPDAGHFIHEDLPEKIAVALIDFWKRNDGKLVLPPKVGAFPFKKKHGQQVGSQ